MTCTASHTVTQADIDAGHYFNQACVDDGAGGAAAGVRRRRPCPAVKNPHLTITKDATETSYDAVGDVIHYTITATNDGNTTLAAVTVTDPNATSLVVHARPTARRSPRRVDDCTASHTVTQADIDAGHYLNTACVNDGAGGAAAGVRRRRRTAGTRTRTCRSPRTPPSRATDAVGHVIHYTITATNDGNTTLAAVTVTDPNATSLVCTPANGSSLAPGASMTCTASHTVTQADIDAGHYFNHACVDDGPGGAAQACDDVTTPAVVAARGPDHADGYDVSAVRK